MSFRARKARASVSRQALADNGDDDGDGDAVVVRRRARIAKVPRPRAAIPEQSMSAAYAAETAGLYATIDEMRAQQAPPPPPAMDAGSLRGAIPSQQAIAAAKFQRQQARAKPASYIPLEKSGRIDVAGGVYGVAPEDGRGRLAVDEDDDDMADVVMDDRGGKVPLSASTRTRTEEMELEDDFDLEQLRIGRSAGKLVDTTADSDDLAPASKQPLPVWSEPEIHTAIASKLAVLRSEQQANGAELSHLANAIVTSQRDREQLDDQRQAAEQKYRHMQGMASELGALLDCVASKQKRIDELYSECQEIRLDRAAHMSDVTLTHWRDLDDGVAITSRPPVSDDVDEFGRPRSSKDAVLAERRQRSRARRSELASKHDLYCEGWTSYGDTDVEVECVQALDDLRASARTVFEDVVDRFASIDGALNVFSRFRAEFPSEYANVYADLSLPTLLAPYLRLALIGAEPRAPSGMSSVIEIARKIRAYNADVEVALAKSVVAPFVGQCLEHDFLPFSLKDAQRCRDFAADVASCWPTMDLAMSLRSTLLNASTSLSRANKSSQRAWGRALKLLAFMIEVRPVLGKQSEFLITAHVNQHLKPVVEGGQPDNPSVERRRRQLQQLLDK
ncbi:unnamed protein product (mitochondrion) [Plasmodiophora brassicae]|uniref:GCF C-terminal domain-containing protein n=1 Tax=Plasmodiophora brassicae TaxID=37360 RepID=A0A0G4IZG7_PLABS|nr:hypothetical protein PBRA_001744 [Plasmodiophora brassicae]SPQ93826.1 unnamed protein product [Plasmodiophora brassicae]